MGTLKQYVPNLYNKFTLHTIEKKNTCSLLATSTTYVVLDCGIPSITLLGTREDYEDIHTRLDKFEGFGDEPRVFAALLRPIIREFIEAFYFNDSNGNPDATPLNPEFWGRICHYKTGDSGPDYLSGWATAFCVWDDDGKWQGPKLATFADPISERERLESNAFYEAHPTSRDDFEVYSPPPVFFGEVRYPVLDFSKVPNGFCEVDVLVDEYGTEFDCTMVAGHCWVYRLRRTKRHATTVSPVVHV